MPPPSDKNKPKAFQKGTLRKGGSPKGQRAAARLAEKEAKEKALELALVPSAEAVVLGAEEARNSLVARDGNMSMHGKLTRAAHLRVAELDFDPLAFAVKVAKGEALTENHPFLGELILWVMDKQTAMEKGKDIDWEGEILDLLDRARGQLTDSWVPHMLRLKANTEIMSYLFPKLKATEHNGKVTHEHLHITPLQKQEIQAFKEVFDANY